MSNGNETTLYFAAPLFSEAEKAFNESLTQEIEALGFNVFLPQRDGMEFAAIKDMSPEERTQKIFELDVRKVEEADIVIAILDGRVPDEGVCVEIAIAHEYRKITGREKKILGLKTDTRSLLAEAEINPMVAGTFDIIFPDRASLIEHLKANHTLS